MELFSFPHLALNPKKKVHVLLLIISSFFLISIPSQDCNALCLTGNKLFCWIIISALAGANRGSTPVFHFWCILSGGSDFCEEQCCGDKREVTPRN